MMNALISLLTELSNSYVRAFRHTCTLAGKWMKTRESRYLSAFSNLICIFCSWYPCEAVKLLSSLVDVALSLNISIENNQKLYEVQKTKTVRQKSTQQLERIQKKITEVRIVQQSRDHSSVGEDGGVSDFSSACFSSFIKLQEKRTEIENMMDVIFKGLFLKRYR